MADEFLPPVVISIVLNDTAAVASLRGFEGTLARSATTMDASAAGMGGGFTKAGVTAKNAEKDLEANSRGFSGRMANVFESLGNSMGSFGVPFGNSVKKMGYSMKEGESAAHGFSASLMSVSKAATLGLGGVAVVIGTLAIKAFDKFDVATKSLETAVTNAHESFKQLEPAINKTEASGVKFGFTTTETASALGILTTSTGSASKASSELSLAQDIARKKHIDLTAAAQVLAKVNAGSLRPLMALGLQYDLGSLKIAAHVKATEAVAHAKTALKAAEENLVTAQKKGAEEHAAAVAKVTSAEETLKQAQEALKGDSEGVTSAQEALKTAQNGVTEAAKHQRAAIKESSEALTSAEEALKTAQNGVTEAAQHQKTAIKEASEGVKSAQEALKTAMNGVTEAAQHQKTAIKEASQALKAAEESAREAAETGVKGVEAAKKNLSELEKEHVKEADAVAIKKIEAEEKVLEAVKTVASVAALVQLKAKKAALEATDKGIESGRKESALQTAHKGIIEAEAAAHKGNTAALSAVAKAHEVLQEKIKDEAAASKENVANARSVTQAVTGVAKAHEVLREKIKAETSASKENVAAAHAVTLAQKGVAKAHEVLKEKIRDGSAASKENVAAAHAVDQAQKGVSAAVQKLSKDTGTVRKDTEALSTAQKAAAAPPKAVVLAEQKLTVAHATLSKAEKTLQKDTVATSEVLSKLSKALHGEHERYMKTYAGQVAKTKAEINKLEVDIGKKLTPVLEKLLKIVQKLIEYFEKHTTQAKILAGALAALALAWPIAKVLGFVTAISKLMIFGKLASMAASFGGGITGIVSKIGPLLVPLLALVAAAWMAYKVYKLISAIKEANAAQGGQVLQEAYFTKAEADLLRIRKEHPGVEPVGGFTKAKKFASGGIVNQPTVAELGESGPEAVIPLAGGKLQVQLLPALGSSGGSAGGGLHVGQIVFNGTNATNAQVIQEMYLKLRPMLQGA